MFAIMYFKIYKYINIDMYYFYNNYIYEAWKYWLSRLSMD